MRMETLKRLRHLARKGDWFFTFDLQDGFYALGIAPVDRPYFTVNIRGQCYQLAGLPMGWSLSPFCFQHLTYAFVKHFRRPTGVPPTQLKGKATRRWLSQRTRSHGIRLLPFVDDFAVFQESYQLALKLKDHVFSTLHRL